MISKSDSSLYSAVEVSELEEGCGPSECEPTTPVTPSCRRKYILMAFISFVVTIVGVAFIVDASGGAERSLESIRRNLSDYTYYKVPFNFAHANDPVVVECTKSVLHPTLEEVPYAEHEGESEKDADYGGGGFKEEEKEVAYAEYEKEVREEEREESFITSGKTSKEDLLIPRGFCVGKEVAHTEYEEELRKEEREKAFITSGKTSEEDVLELHTREHTDLPDFLDLPEELREGESKESFCDQFLNRSGFKLGRVELTWNKKETDGKNSFSNITRKGI